jgi:protein-tyrosine kinase
MGKVTNVRTRIFETGDVAGSAWLSTTITHHVPEMAGEMVSFLAPGSREADQYRALRYCIEERHQQGVQVIGVTSPAPGEGKTLTCVNLAGTLGQARDRRVLLIDADFHQASVGRFLGISSAGGPKLGDIIRADGGQVAHAVHRIDALNLSVILPGALDGSAYDLLDSPRFEQIIRDARAQYDFIVIDTPPVMVLPDVRVISRVVDGFVLVVAAHRTTRAALTGSLELLDRSKIIGTVLNGDDRRHKAYESYYKNRPTPRTL